MLPQDFRRRVGQDRKLYREALLRVANNAGAFGQIDGGWARQRRILVTQIQEPFEKFQGDRLLRVESARDDGRQIMLIRLGENASLFLIEGHEAVFRDGVAMASQ